MNKKTVYYKGKGATRHKLAYLVNGKNVLDVNVADKLLKLGVVTLSSPISSTDDYKNKSIESLQTKKVFKNKNKKKD